MEDIKQLFSMKIDEQLIGGCGKNDDYKLISREYKRRHESTNTLRQGCKIT